jgi:8-hydroxy-5-deazaflavin:NADPH oxidoreductase
LRQSVERVIVPGMNVTIIGTGGMARGIATRALAGGNSVTLLGRSSDAAQALAGELQGEVRTGTVGDPVTGDVVVLAVPYAAIDDVIGELDGKVVVDITNPVDFASFTPLDVEAGSAAQEIAGKLPAARVVKAFNTTFAATLLGGEVAGRPLDVFIAADDGDAKRIVSELVRAGGLNPLDAGPLARAHELEALGYLHMAIQEPLGTGFASTIKLLH